MFLKVSPFRGLIRFGKKGKLSPRFIGPFKILERVGAKAYRLVLLPSIIAVNDVYHVSMLRKYIRGSSHVLKHQEVEITQKFQYKIQLARIVDRTEKILRTKVISLVKVLWKSHTAEDVTL